MDYGEYLQTQVKTGRYNVWTSQNKLVGERELTQLQVKALRSTGHKVHKVGDE